MRDHILSEIRRLAAASGQPPGEMMFVRETGIAVHQWRGKFWARWSDALLEAGCEPNKWIEKLDSSEVLNGIVSACRFYRRFPTKAEMELYRKTDPRVPSSNAITRHFGSRSDLIIALAEKASHDASCADIAAMLPDVPKLIAKTSAGSKAREGFVYLFKSGDFYKIGRSDDIERRVKQIRVALPEKLTPIHSIRTDDPSGIEAYWHRRFADKRANGEWFKLTSLDISAFRRRTYQ